MNRQRIPITGYLAGLPLFEKTDGAVLDRLAAGTSERDAPRGTVVFRRGQAATGMYIVVFGQVKLSLHTGNGDERVIGLVDPGMRFGEASAFAGVPYRVTAETIVDSKLLHLHKDVLVEEMRRNADFSQLMVVNLSTALLRHVQQLEICTLSSGVQRVIRYLLDHDRADGRDGELHITLPTKKWIIASRLNLTQEHFSRILHALIRRELIEVEGRNVRIRDPLRLRAYGAD